MTVVLLCATADEAARYPGFEAVSVSNFRALEGLRVGAAFATRRAREMPDYGQSLSMVLASVCKMVGATGAFPQVAILGGDLPPDVERVA